MKRVFVNNPAKPGKMFILPTNAVQPGSNAKYVIIPHLDDTRVVSMAPTPATAMQITRIMLKLKYPGGWPPTTIRDTKSYGRKYEDRLKIKASRLYYLTSAEWVSWINLHIMLAKVRCNAVSLGWIF